MITLVPAFTPVRTPAFVIVATPVLDEVHGFAAAGVPEPINVMVDDLHRDVGPLIVGRALTVTVAVIEQPLLLV